MERCLQLAKNGLGSTYPNPMVGSVIVHENRIIGEGWHQKAGGPHAEVFAINGVADKDLLPEATIYVSLEPCSHYGKTPPCADLIIASKIKKVVIGTTDPFVEVAGRGVKKLLEAGCEVIVGVLEEKCRDLNKRFFTFHQKKRPYIIFKWAETADGFIAPAKEIRTEKKPVWITGKRSRQLVHKWRTEEMAILVGTNTALEDNPSLTARDWHGNNPVRVVLDKIGKISAEAKVFDGAAQTLVLTEKSQKIANSTEAVAIDFEKPIAQEICRVLFEHNLQSVIVEGGAKLLQTFINENLWDEARVFRGTPCFLEGVKAPNLKAIPQKQEHLDGDELLIFCNHSEKRK